MPFNTHSFLQDVWLWEAALHVTSSVRKQVYGHVQMLGLSYFEGAGDTAAGDTAYRLTAEADQLGAMVFAFLQVSCRDSYAHRRMK